MKKAQLSKIYRALTALKDSPEESNIKLRYGIKKNLSIIEPEIKVLRELEEENKKILKDLLDEQETFIKEKGKTDAQGNKYIPFTAENLSKEDKALAEEFSKKLEELNEKYKEQLEEYNKKNEEYTKMLQETEVGTDITFHKMAPNPELWPAWTTKAPYGEQVDILIEAGVISE